MSNLCFMTAREQARLVRDREVYEEPLTFSGASDGKRNITIEAERDADGKSAVLRASGPEPILVIDRIEGLQLLGFTLDGQKKCDDLVKLTGYCAGTKLSTLRLHGFNRSAIRLENCQGANGRDVELRDLRIDPGMRYQPLHEPRRRQPVDVAIPDLQPGPDGVTKAMQLGGVAERDPPQPTREQFVGLRAGTPRPQTQVRHLRAAAARRL